MNEEKALEILNGIELKGEEYVRNSNGWISFYKDSGEAVIDGSFTAEELEAIIYLCRKRNSV